MNLTDAIQRAIRMAGPTGSITFEQLNDLLPSALASEDIEVLISALSAENIQIVEAS